MKIKILLCNDDGIYAPGLRSLWEALQEANFGEVMIIAPLTERSGAGASISWDRPILVQQHDQDWPQTPAWSVDGTPADCIKMAASVILETMPSLIVSGINAGSNAGRNVLHSGTVGAVIEGLWRGIPGIAFSCESGTQPNYASVKQYIIPLIRYALEHPAPSGTFLNVNFPHAPVKGFRLTRQGKARWFESPRLHFKSDLGTSFWLGGVPEEREEHYECDTALLKEGFITVVPIQVDELTHQIELERRQKSFENFFMQTTENLVRN